MKLSTVVNLPYTIPTSSTQKGMKFYCEYDTSEKSSAYITSATVSSSIYEGDYDGPITADDSIVIRTTPNKFAKYNLTDSETVINNIYKLKIWFPVEQLSTYYKKYNLYHIFVYTYINDTMDILYSGVIDSMNNLSGAPFIYKGIRYQEYQEIPLSHISAGQTSIYTSQIYISINSVSRDKDVYYTNTNTFPGASFISSNQTPLSLSLTAHDNNTNGFHLEVLNLGNTTFPTYLKHKYFDAGGSYTLFYRFLIVDKYNEEVLLDKLVQKNFSTVNKFSVLYTDIFKTDDDLKAISPDLSYPVGLQVVVNIEAYNGSMKVDDIDDDTYPVITISSNPLMLSECIWGQMRAAINYNFSASNLLKKIDNMSTNISVKNIIETNTIKVNQNTTEGVIKPVFYRAYALDSVVLHKDVKENILVNLDGYLSQVSKFYIKINGEVFGEYARVYDGVVFTVEGLSGEDGIYYILDEDKQLVTSGKFTFEV